jgi:hypothetical protein
MENDSSVVYQSFSDCAEAQFELNVLYFEKGILSSRKKQ